MVTVEKSQLANGVPRHLKVEDLRSFATVELAVATPWQAGVCFLPECGRRFQPARDWQMYCCTECERAGTAEMRKWGHRMALSALTWRMGKYEKHDTAIRDLTRAARRHVTHVQSAWLSDRQSRAAASGGGDGI
ncbi:hypothetical protein [Epibacterium sp. Ofav1-8]|uniref:hypothetical protein n=1 Tax=Epibacterium sp. Ofav1-8 TaxID=2917735 RepID=UPI001EF4B397|nr:hypothetical protein [Epibacterium sp. Ofav1-8]MCG7625558.1 hypothetical protein [Epibacterium sp. Ofav1-8]